jgi:hypothetical protein
MTTDIPVQTAIPGPPRAVAVALPNVVRWPAATSRTRGGSAGKPLRAARGIMVSALLGLACWVALIWLAEALLA